MTNSIGDGVDDKWFQVSPQVESILKQNKINEVIWRVWGAGGDKGLTNLGLVNINHAKVWLFEDIHGRPVSIVSSSNWRTSDRSRENSAIITSDTAVYDELERLTSRVWSLADAQLQTTDDWHLFGKTVEFDRDFETYITPSAKGQPAPRDPHLELLKDVRCTPTNGKPSSEIVWVAGSTWSNGGRGKLVMDELIRIKKDGCDVRIIGAGVGIDGPETTDAIFDRAKAANIPWSRTATHNKYIVVWAPLASRNKVRTDVVVAGALNFTSSITSGGMLEVTHKIFGHAVVKRFRDDWLRVCKANTSASPDACLPQATPNLWE